MLKVYGDLNSGNCYKVKLLLHMLDIEHDWIEVDILKQETHTDEFKAINPNAKIPALVLERGDVLWESNAILNYLADGTIYLPSKKFIRSKVLQWQFFEQYSHEPNIAVARYIKVYLGMPKKRRAEYKKKIAGGYKALDVMESHLREHDYFVGDFYSIADISLYAYTHVAEQGGFDLSTYPAVLRWMSRIESRLKHQTMHDFINTDQRKKRSAMRVKNAISEISQTVKALDSVDNSQAKAQAVGADKSDEKSSSDTSDDSYELSPEAKLSLMTLNPKEKHFVQQTLSELRLSKQKTKETSPAMTEMETATNTEDIPKSEIASSADSENKTEKAVKLNPGESIYGLMISDIDGKEMAFDDYKGQVLLMVNVASKCGYTPQYRGLHVLHEKYREQGFSVIGLPCNQFGSQEPDSEEEIKSFCIINFDVMFPMTSKIEVNGPARHPVYDVLAGDNAAFPGDIGWNFEKFLVGKDGRVIKRYAPDVEPTASELIKDVEKALAS